jgi:3-oxoacyl-[acyl-carrier-protein] synthase III
MSGQPSRRPQGEVARRNAVISGWGAYLPPGTLTNHDLEGRLGVSDEWIRARTGITERRLAASDQTTTSLCAAAARRALARARLAAGDVDLIVCATMTPDHLLPATGCLVQERLGAVHAGAFDLNAACCGFVYALVVAAGLVESGRHDRVLVVAGETLGRFVDRGDRGTAILFGDGAGAVVLEATDRDGGLRGSVLGCRGDVDRRLVIEAGGSARPASAATVAAGQHVIRMRGHEVFKLAVRGMVEAGREALARADLTAADLHILIPHQANGRLLEAAREALGVAAEKTFVNVHRYGNTGAASVPIALAEFLDAAPVQAGEHLLLVAFGGGLTWAATVVRWADVDAVVSDRLEGPRAAWSSNPDARHLQEAAAGSGS